MAGAYAAVPCDKYTLEIGVELSIGETENEKFTSTIHVIHKHNNLDANKFQTINKLSFAPGWE